MSLPMDKRVLRATLLQQRAALTVAQREHLSHAAQSRVLKLSIFHDAEIIALYSPIRNEVETGLLAKAALQNGKTLCFPCVDGESLRFYAVDSLADLETGCFGVCEPPRCGREVSAARIDFLLVPGVAFDSHGQRLGYGQGFFDRFLVQSGFCGSRVALGYDFQVVDLVPAEEHDQAVDLLVTDKRLIIPS